MSSQMGTLSTSCQAVLERQWDGDGINYDDGGGGEDDDGHLLQRKVCSPPHALARYQDYQGSLDRPQGEGELFFGFFASNRVTFL